jgi:ketosteroid isomerase-like protein
MRVVAAGSITMMILFNGNEEELQWHPILRRPGRYELFKQGDISTFVKDIVDPTCTWISPGPQDKLPWAGSFKGQQEIADFFARVGQNLDFAEVALREMIEQGETVVAIGTSSARVKRTGKAIKSDWVHIFKYKQGRMVFAQEYTDTAASILAMS